MTSLYRDILRRHARPLEPIPTGEQPSVRRLERVRAVLFDVYGTLVVSASGEVGTVEATQRADAFSAALDACGIAASFDAEDGVKRLGEKIRASHERSRLAGIEYPEVDIVAVWRATLEDLFAEQSVTNPRDGILDYRQLAVEYEARTNPVWPMPGAEASLATIRDRGFMLGLISNAQFYTPLVFEALWNRSVGELGFDPELAIYSYRLGEAKPSETLFEAAIDVLARREVGPHQILYVGNDLLNDITPASKLGLVTALFAGDARSLRRRAGDPRVAGIEPDLILTDLHQLADALPS